MKNPGQYIFPLFLIFSGIYGIEIGVKGWDLILAIFFLMLGTAMPFVNYIINDDTDRTSGTDNERSEEIQK